MRTWDDYKNYVRSVSPESRDEIEKCEELSHILTSALQGLHNCGLTIFSAGKTALYNTRGKKKKHTIKESK